MPTPRGQEAQLDQVVEAHRIAREGRIDNASGKEEDIKINSAPVSRHSGRPAAVRAEPVQLAGWAVLGELAAGTCPDPSQAGQERGNDGLERTSSV